VKPKLIASWQSRIESDFAAASLSWFDRGAFSLSSRGAFIVAIVSSCFFISGCGITDLRAEVRAEAPIGSSRAHLYQVLREKNLVAYNPILQHWRVHTNGGGVDALDYGEFPQAGQTPQPIADSSMADFFEGERKNFNSRNPFVYVKYSWKVCRLAVQAILFDRKDRVKEYRELGESGFCR